MRTPTRSNSDRSAQTMSGPAMLLRPPGSDRSRYWEFTSLCTPDDLRQRFGVPIPPDTAGDKLLNITGASIQSLAAFGREGTLLALAQIVAIAPTTAEVGIMVRSDHKKRGIGRALLAALVNEARAAHLIELRATVLRENLAMRGLARKVGFVTFGSSGLVIEFRFIL